MEKLFDGLLVYAVLLFSLSFHEFGHAWVALRCGDPTAQSLGRVTLNPIAHADPVGTVLFPLVQIFSGVPLLGWAKPVPVDAHNLRRPRRDQILVAGAGPGANLVLAMLAAIVLRISDAFWTNNVLGGFCAMVLPFAIQLNVMLAVFNLIPITPLDGSWILCQLLPAPAARKYAVFGHKWGFAVVLVLLFSGAAWVWIRTASALIAPVLDAIAGIPVGL